MEVVVAPLPLERPQIVAPRNVVHYVRVVHQLGVRKLPQLRVLVFDPLLVAVLGDAEPAHGVPEHVQEPLVVGADAAHVVLDLPLLRLGGGPAASGRRAGPESGGVLLGGLSALRLELLFVCQEDVGDLVELPAVLLLFGGVQLAHLGHRENVVFVLVQNGSRPGLGVVVLANAVHPVDLLRHRAEVVV